MKTPLETLIEWVETGKADGSTPQLNILHKAQSLLDSEKQMIIDAHHAGQIDIVNTFIEESLFTSERVKNELIEKTKDDFEDSKQYFETNFSKQK